MALVARYLIDTSAAARAAWREVSALLSPLVESGAVATCAALDAEALYSARNWADFDKVRERRRRAYEYLPTDDEHWQRAFDAQHELARSGRHRAVGLTDLLVAVLASQHRLILLHYDADFEIAAEVLDLDQRWVAEPGSMA